MEDSLVSRIFQHPAATLIPLDEMIMQAVGEASMCWSNIEGAGVFNSEKAKKIGDNLLKYLEHREKECL